MSIPADKSFDAAWTDYEARVCGFCDDYPSADIMELGGGRSPLFSLSDLPGSVSSYTINDVSADELALAPAGYKTACFDVCGDVAEYAGRYDVIFSKMLAEHVPDGAAMHRNVLKLLKPGGVAFHFMPTLFSSPFVVNRLLPSAAAHRLLSLFQRERLEHPVFPATYSWCSGPAHRLKRRVSGLGYASVDVHSFYGHGYYDKIPVVRELEAMLCRVAASNDWTVYASFAYLIARKERSLNGAGA